MARARVGIIHTDVNASFTLRIWYMRFSDFCQYFAALTIAASVRRVAEMLRSVFIAGALPQ